jgi:hypothetical protein
VPFVGSYLLTLALLDVALLSNVGVTLSHADTIYVLLAFWSADDQLVRVRASRLADISAQPPAFSGDDELQLRALSH